ncbi:MAG: hypothetical protein KA201_06595 [Kofleriaceae bacterium]|nr:hypothetical protein [Kofleriaceae bacterium]
MTPRSSNHLCLGLALAALVAACGKGGDKPAAGGTGAPSAATPTPTAPAAPPPSAPAAPPPAAVDPYAQGFCEYTIDGGAPNKGGGGMNNVLSLHWFAPDQQGRGLASTLLINCGTGAQVNLMSSSDATPADVPMAPKKYPITKGNKAGAFSVMGPDFMGGEGELDITAWDTSHVAGTFGFAAGGKQYSARFDIKCPFPSNGVCK